MKMTPEMSAALATKMCSNPHCLHCKVRFLKAAAEALQDNAGDDNPDRGLFMLILAAGFSSGYGGIDEATLFGMIRDARGMGERLAVQVAQAAIQSNDEPTIH